MPGFGGAVIPMKDKLKFVLGTEEVLEKITSQEPIRVYAKETMEFLKEISKKIREREEKTPDLAAFGFWCRHLKHPIQNCMGQETYFSAQKEYVGQGNSRPAQENRKGRGVSLHFAASNMPMLFVYSMAAALLAGNCVIMRLSDKETEQEQIFLEVLKEVMEEQPLWKERIVLIRYEHNSRITDYLSGLCGVRIIWGRVVY